MRRLERWRQSTRSLTPDLAYEEAEAACIVLGSCHEMTGILNCRKYRFGHTANVLSGFGHRLQHMQARSDGSRRCSSGTGVRPIGSWISRLPAKAGDLLLNRWRHPAVIAV